MADMPDKYRQAVLERQQGCCACCRRPARADRVRFDPDSPSGYDTVVCRQCLAIAKRPALLEFTIGIADYTPEHAASVRNYIGDR